jgi:iron complex outermembrane receptor protein
VKAHSANAFAGVGLLAIAMGAGAQTPLSTATQAAALEEQGEQLQEIIVTARRREETLEDVPQTVDVVSADTVRKLNILNFTDLQAIVPGLTMSVDPGGINDTVSMRGVSYSIFSQNPLPTVALYLNDALAGPQVLFQSLYDIGQVEVLRGPQGTLHGEPAPSGAITLTTHKPDLSQFGGYVDATGYSEDVLHGPEAFNAQGALNVPIIQGVLALRVAGVIQDNHLDLVRSLYNSENPYSHTKSGRATLSFVPTDSLDTTFTYQHLEVDTQNFNQVIGTGSLGGTFAPPALLPNLVTGSPPYTTPAVVAPGFNGPPITPEQRLSVDNAANSSALKYDVVTGQANWHFAGQHLAYTGNWSDLSIETITASDVGNLLPGGDFTDFGLTKVESQEHELRLMSDERILGMFDYTIGARYTRGIPGKGTQPTEQYAGLANGAFGTGAAANPYAFNPSDLVPIYIFDRATTYERSLFFNATAHLGDRTELSAGIRSISYDYSSFIGSNIVLGPLKIPEPFPASNYKDTASIYNASLSYHFTEGLMAYATTGSSWRPGTTELGVNNATDNPTISALQNLHPEYSHSYEIGFKALFLDKRAQVNVAIYHQYFSGFVFNSLYAPYLSATSTLAPPSISVSDFATNANSVVDGLDLDGSFRVTPRWSLTAAFSYANGHVDNAATPCTPPGVNINNPTVASFQAAVAAAGQPGALVYLCKNNQAVSQAPSWNTTVQSEYTRPIAKGLDGYARGYVSFYPSNPNAVQGYDVPSYAIFNLFLGVRDPTDSWEISVFAKNLFNRFVLLNKPYFQVQEINGNINSAFGNSGYYGGANSLQVTPPMQLGVNLRYTFGSR